MPYKTVLARFRSRAIKPHSGFYMLYKMCPAVASVKVECSPRELYMPYKTVQARFRNWAVEESPSGFYMPYKTLQADLLTDSPAFHWTLYAI